MAPEKSHKAWLTFVRKVVSVAAGYSRQDLWEFRNLASYEAHSFVPIVEAYLRLVENSETNVSSSKIGPRKSRGLEQMHLFDLLRDKKFFPTNLDLAEFASRVVPHMRAYRWDKMSRGDIAARIIEYLEQSGTRDKLEVSMREAFGQLDRPAKASERRSFFSKWERIIKGIEL
ncbi:hypothetical protein JQ604_35295 [Bradyrhizobium jicamae]|uniref:hypothetical protein n=1 Tax=Bradyrhizobium jicamae TaxID=280332 RepID=UPI001BA48BE7|nr:hypothetical protein [Bradyrhizobium jicamae]MBR0757477.1 hypothetical protein [Bradyrhizobium jicamae]